MDYYLPFITGSRAYGEPKPESDIDLVVCCDSSTDDDQVLWDHSESKDSCRYGKLNLIILPANRFLEWKRVNDELIARDHVVTRDEAIEAFQAAGFTQDEYGVGKHCPNPPAEGDQVDSTGYANS